MNKAVYYHIYITPKNGVDLDTVQSKIELALDWFKYDKTNFVVYSTSDVKKWMTRLRPLVKPDGYLFVCELNEKNRNGWMNKKFWEWMKKER